ncbi:hypothetical protein [Cellulomonas avistercoris]|uniref:hypothetical protein n=1 Tax=Cellulomonas avistercoris TaxID=2762242 RepID=UPI001CD90A42|nr:hypothetical protein [Cellulomonas avistercoris]
MTAAVEHEKLGRRLGPPTLVALMLVVAYLAVASGLFYAGMALLGRGTSAEAPVRLTAPVGYMAGVWPCVDGWSMDGSSCGPAASGDVWPGGQPLPVRHGGELLAGADVDPVTALLASAGAWGGLVAGGVVGLVLIPALRSTASGRPFARGNARRLGWAAAVVMVAWVVATVGDVVAASRIIAVIEATPRWSPTGSFAMPADWLAPTLVVGWWPLPVVLLLLALAAATGRGTRLTSDTEGLV